MATYCSACGKPLAPGVKFCGECGVTTGRPVESTLAAVSGSQSRPTGPRCVTCGVGVLRLEKRYRMSAPVVAIGYVFVLPSVFGIGVCVLAFVNLMALRQVFH
jgi:hypothetical protein